MNAYSKIFTVVVGLALSAISHAQTDLIGSIKPSAGGAVIELGLSSDQTIKGLQFDIKAPEGSAFGSVKLDGCLSQLPKAFSASTCTQINDSTIRVVVLSLSGAEVPSGFIGRVFVSSPVAGPGPSNEGKVGFSREAGRNVFSLDDIQFTNVVIGGDGGSRVDVDFAGMAVERGSR